MVEEEEQGGEDARGQVIICRLTVGNMHEDCMYMRKKKAVLARCLIHVFIRSYGLCLPKYLTTTSPN